MRKTIIAAALVLASSSAFAVDDPYGSAATMSNFSYDYVDARIGVSPVTYGAAFSRSIHPNAHVIARVDSEFDGDYDAAGGLGFHAPINNWADLTGAMLFRMTDSGNTSNSLKGTDTGMELNLGVRQWLGPQLEVGGKAGYTSIDEKDDWIGSIYGRFHSTELFSIGVEARFNDFYGDQLMFTTRFNY
ncbi:hypothetical protein M9194_15030 [Vibrio sp. S4M6]|uniref:hypothetical protein n=1 Tax=Vibrio sinus TaxID=2946865 RepID=UPI00202A8CFB|nr:hypothetical protein [Vibrio sinus]MCL9782747.1 hypothetical protein [Vibrio sinus]